MNSRWCTGKGRPAPSLFAMGAFDGKAAEAVGGIRKVLVVDDEADVADLAEVLLAANGLDTVVAYSGADALVQLEAHPDIDAVVSDVMMPGMTGIELAERITERFPKVKIILASGYMAPKLSAGQPLKQLFVAKPYRIEQILKLLRT